MENTLKDELYRYCRKQAIGYVVAMLVSLLVVTLYVVAYKNFKFTDYTGDANHQVYLTGLFNTWIKGMIAIIILIWYVSFIVRNIISIKITVEVLKGLDGYVINTDKLNIVDLYRNYYCDILSEKGKLNDIYNICYIKYIELNSGRKIALDISKNEFVGVLQEDNLNDIEDKIDKLVKNEESVKLMQEYMDRQNYDNIKNEEETEEDGSKED